MFCAGVFVAEQACLAQQNAQAPRAIPITERLPYGLPPVDYSRKSDVDDPVARLNRRLGTGRSRLRFNGPNGYLKSLLAELNIPVESQLLVYSKTALNQRLIGPQRPRAIYFNDDVYVAWVPGAAALEIATADPLKGANFYTLPQSAEKPPRFEREESCLACHAGRTTMSIPGHMVRSFLVRDSGKPVSGYSRITHDTDYAKRWGGWYVTGKGTLAHLGNLVGEKQNRRHREEPRVNGNITDLAGHFNTRDYLSSHSDVVAHLVLDHQAHGHNLITRVAMEHRFGRRSDAEKQLALYLLFAAEPPLTSPLRGTTRFQTVFEKRGPRDRRGRSLRQFNLKTRLFQYRLSYLIYSKSFDGLPRPARLRVLRRLWNILTERDQSIPRARFPARERRAIREIVADTKTDLPAYWTKPDQPR